MIGLLDIGGTKLAASVADGDRLGAVVRTTTPASAPEAALAGLLAAVAGDARLSAIGVSAPGPFDRDAAALLDPPGMPPVWHGFRLSEDLGERFGCPVVVENDANCAALAEARRGAGTGDRVVVYFTVSTGIGSGVVREGRLIPVRTDTEGGHQVLWPEWVGGPSCHCGGHGCLETIASGLAIERRFGVRAERLNDAAAWRDVGRWLGLGVVNAVALHDPDSVLFGGGVCGSWDRFAPSMIETVESHLFLQRMPRIEMGSLGEERPLIGALEVVKDRSA
ncbi:MAG: ROK family protein [Candidatus Dormibacteraeota bacterium]|nr:ROK family protein [Candidatus Dormibacteraeota bacterium]